MPGFPNPMHHVIRLMKMALILVLRRWGFSGDACALGLLGYHFTLRLRDLSDCRLLPEVRVQDTGRLRAFVDADPIAQPRGRLWSLAGPTVNLSWRSGKPF
jgi:hypothetical protein